MRKLSGTTIVELTTPGPVRPGAGIALGKLSFAGIPHGRRRTVLLLPSQYIETCALSGIQPLVRRVENVRTELDRVSTA